MDVVLVRYEIAEGRTDDLRKWFDGVRDRDEEVESVLRREGMYTESLFVEEVDGTDYLLWYMEAEDIARVLEVYDESTDAVVEESERLFEEVLVGGMDGAVSETELLLHAVGPDRPGEATVTPR